jgi:tellurite resistance protein TerC
MNGQDLERIALEYYVFAKRMVKVVVGFTLLAIGIALIFLPGPAFVVIPVSLAILAGEFVWARRLLRKVKREVVRYTSGK